MVLAHILFILNIVLIIIDYEVLALSCYSNISDISKVREGKWENNFYPYLSNFTRSTILTKIWTEEHCPVEHEHQCCYLHYGIPKGESIEKRKFIYNNCEMKDFNPIDFLNLLKNKRILFAGDSVTGQFFVNIVCSLHGYAKAVADVVWVERAGCTERCGFADATITYPDYDVVLIHHNVYHPIRQMYDPKLMITMLTTKSKLRKNDIMLFNLGLHYSTKREYKEVIHDFAKEITAIKRLDKANPFHKNGTSTSTVLTNSAQTNIPFIFWQETSPQHFKHGHSNGYFDHSYRGKNPECVKIDLKVAFTEDWRNRIVENILTPLDVPILRINHPAASQYDAHAKYPHNADCTHYCNPSGVLYAWRDVLFNAIETVIRTGKIE